MKEPWFWRDKGLAAGLAQASLAPLSALYAGGAQLREILASPARIEKPVICMGNMSLGGVGKTPFTAMLRTLLSEKGVSAAIAMRGYGGKLRGPLRIDPAIHKAADVGDEAVMLSAGGPVFIGADRVAGARLAGGAADVVLLDDGYQNPSIAKTQSILLIPAGEAASRFKVFPAGPMRETPARAVARADIIVEIAEDRHAPLSDETRRLVGDKPLYRAWTTPLAPAPKKVIAFCGIGAPDRFFRSLDRAGYEVAGARAFADHHPFTEKEIAGLRRAARAAEASLVTTEKDAARLSPELSEGIETFRISMELDDPDGIIARLISACRFGKEAP